MASSYLIKLLQVSGAWRRFLQAAPDGIDEALDFVDHLEHSGMMARDEAGHWRWRVLACWAERERRAPGARSARGGGGGKVLPFPRARRRVAV